MDACQDVGGCDGSRSIGAHAAGVGACVALADALVVLGRGQGNDGVAVREGEEGEFWAVEELLDDDLAAWNG